MNGLTFSGLGVNTSDRVETFEAIHKTSMLLFKQK